MRFASFSLNANLYVILIVGAFLAAGLLFGEARLKRIAMAVLAGLFVADQLSGFFATQLARVGLKDVDMALLQFILLFVTTGLLSIGKVSGGGGRLSIRTLVLAVTSAATLIAYSSSYFGAVVQAELSTDYNLVAIAVDNRSWWLAGMVVWLAVLQIWKKKSPDDDDGGKKGKKKKK